MSDSRDARTMPRRDFLYKIGLIAGTLVGLLSGCRKRDRPAPAPSTPPPSVPTKPQAASTARPGEPPPGGKCGDGICDEAERENPDLCPQDCQPEATEAAPLKEAAEPSNIVFILVDDLSYTLLPYMPKTKTLIADQGTTLSNFLVSMPLCCPSRATILRGQYGHNTEIMGNDLPQGGWFKFSELGEEDSTVATWLQGAGYRTMLAGKYLNAFPDSSDPMHIPPGWTEWYSPVDDNPFQQYDYVLNENGRQVAYGKEPDDYGTDVYARKSIDFIQRSMQEGQPFFAHISVYAPHYPYTPAPRHAGLFSDVRAPRTPNFNEGDVSDKPPYISSLPLLTESDIAQIDEDFRQQLRSMQAVDEMVESIVHTLQAGGQLDNTFIFFTSDNGCHHGSHRQPTGKTAPYEEETRVTMIVRGPGVPAGVTLDHLAGNTDLAPTWADIAGVESPDFVDGRSLVPLVGSGPPPMDRWRQSFLIEHARFESVGQSQQPAAKSANSTEGGVRLASMGTEAWPYRGIRTANYTYVEYPTGHRELYDLRNDPYQLENVVETADPALVEALATRLAELAESSGEQCREVEDRPIPYAASSSAIVRRPETGIEPLIYYLGYATEDNMRWIQEFDVDVLVRGFLLFLNSTDAWVTEYGARMEQAQAEGRQFLVALQAAVLVEHGRDIPTLEGNDPALALPMESIPRWKEYACRTAEGLTLGEAANARFAHSCLNNAEFREFLKDRLRAVIDSGADGVHIDELQTRYFTRMEGYCDACVKGFQDYLADRYSSDALKSRYDIADIGSFDFRARLAEEGNLKTPPQSPLHSEWWLYQLSSLAHLERELLSFCKSYASGNGRQIVFNTNAYEPEQNPDRLIEMLVSDFSSIGTGMTMRLRRGSNFVSELRVPPSYSYVPLYRMARGLTPDKPVTLFIDGPDGTETMKALPEREQSDIVRWMFAEAYSAGARFLVPYPSLDYSAPLDACRSYAEFIQQNREVYEGTEHLADVAVLFSYASEIWDYWVEGSSGEPHHSLQWYGLCQALTDISIQYDVIVAADGNVLEDNLTLDDLIKHDLLIVPWAYSLRDEHVKLLEEYAEAGKRLVIIGDFASFDEEKNRRPIDVLASSPSLKASVAGNLDFESYLADPAGRDALAVREELNSLATDRVVSITNYRVTAQVDIKGKTLYCHLVNKDRRASGFKRQTDFKVRISLPPDMRISDGSAAYLSPEQSGGQATMLPMGRQGNVVEVNIPVLEVYGVLVIPGTGYE